MQKIMSPKKTKRELLIKCSIFFTALAPTAAIVVGLENLLVFRNSDQGLTVFLLFNTQSLAAPGVTGTDDNAPIILQCMSNWKCKLATLEC